LPISSDKPSPAGVRASPASERRAARRGSALVDRAGGPRQHRGQGGEALNGFAGVPRKSDRDQREGLGPPKKIPLPCDKGIDRAGNPALSAAGVSLYSVARGAKRFSPGPYRLLELIASLPFRVPIAHQVGRAICSLMNLTDPSQKAAFTPPVWKLVGGDVP
jgi:hypothetical protein